MEYFNLKDLFSKIYSLLSKGGLFCFLVNYWWWPVNSTGIVGDFPYVCQRLTSDDLRRYFQEHYPEKTEDIMERYEYYHRGKQQPTLNNIIKIAFDSGLQIVGTRRMIPQENTHPKTPFTPKFMMSLDNSLIFDTLEDIHQFKRDVQLIDLHTAFILGVFQKL